MSRARLAAAACAAAACAAPPVAPPGDVTIVDGYDWSVPPGVGVRPDTGLYSEEVAPERGVEAAILDLTWRQLEPVPGTIRRDAVGHAEGFDFGPWNDQRKDGGRYWLRLWMTDVDDAPAWVAEACAVVGAPALEDPCVWGHARAFLRRVLVDEGVAADPDFVLLDVPRAFTWRGRDPAPLLAAPTVLDVPATPHLGPDDHAPINDDASADDHAAAHRVANLTALVAGVTWRYVTGGDRDLVDHGAHWRWVRHQLGRTAADAFDGWVALEPTGDLAHLVARTGATYAVDPRWLTGVHDVDLAITFVDTCTSLRLTYATTAGPVTRDVPCTATSRIRTARLHLPAARFTGTTDLTLSGADLLLVRLVRR